MHCFRLDNFCCLEKYKRKTTVAILHEVVRTMADSGKLLLRAASGISFLNRGMNLIEYMELFRWQYTAITRSK